MKSIGSKKLSAHQMRLATLYSDRLFVGLQMHALDSRRLNFKRKRKP
jgi:hypothetical protein